MARHSWSFISDLPPRGNYDSSFDFANDVSEIILDNYSGEITPEMRLSVLYFGHLCSMVVENGTSVITNQEIQDAVRYSNSTTHEARMLHNSEIESWLLRAGFKKLDTDYCTTGKYDQYSCIYCAPIGLSVEDISEKTGNQPVISVKSIEQILRKDIAKKPGDSKDDSDGRVPEITENELSAYIGLIRNEFHKENWVRGEANEAINELWLNPEELSILLESDGAVLTNQEIERKIIDVILDCTTELQSNAQIDIDGALGNLKSVLQSKFGWNRIWFDSGEGAIVKWYSSKGQFERELKEAENHFRSKFDVVNHWEDLSAEELKRRKLFLSHNRTQLELVLGYQPEKLDDRIRQLSGQVEYQEQMAPLDGASSSPASDDLPSRIESPTSNDEHRKRSFWILQQQLKESEEDMAQ